MVKENKTNFRDACPERYDVFHHGILEMSSRMFNSFVILTDSFVYQSQPC